MFVSLREMVELFNELAVNPDCRAVVFSGAGEVFTAGRTSVAIVLSGEPGSSCVPVPGIDLMDMANDVLQPGGKDTARKCWQLRKKIVAYQETFSVLERVSPEERRNTRFFTQQPGNLLQSRFSPSFRSVRSLLWWPSTAPVLEEVGPSSLRRSPGESTTVSALDQHPVVSHARRRHDHSLRRSLVHPGCLVSGQGRPILWPLLPSLRPFHSNVIVLT